MDNDKIILYLQGGLTAEERLDFENQLSKDAALKEHTAQIEGVLKNLSLKFDEGGNEAELKTQLKEFNKQYFVKEKPMRRIGSNWAWLSGVAAAVLILLIWSPWKKDLLAQYGSIEMPIMAERGASNRELLIKGATFFNDKEYDKASINLRQVLMMNPTNNNTLTTFYLGVAYLHENKIDSAQYFLQQITMGESIYRHKAEYYMSLTEIKSKNYLSAKQWLAKIPKGATIFEKSQRLLHEIENK